MLIAYFTENYIRVKPLERYEVLFLYGTNHIDCAQIVPVRVKYFQTVPNETKNTMKN